MKPVPLFGEGIQSYSPFVTAQRRLNCYYDVRKDNDKSTVVVKGTPGSEIWVTLPTGPIRGWRFVSPYLYVVSGDVLYDINTSGVFTVRGYLSTESGFVELSDNSIQLMIVDGVSGYLYTIATTTLTTISDTFFISDLNGCKTIEFIDGRFIVEKPGITRQFYISAPYDGDNWQPNSGASIFGTKENSSDQLLAVQVYSGLLILFGSQTTEFWQDVGASPNPFQRINGTTQSWGIAALRSRVITNNSLIFLAQNLYGGVKVMSVVGNSMTPISTPDIETWITSFGNYSDAVALSYTVEGHTFYQITFQSAERTFVYDTTTGFWGEAQTGVSMLTRHYAQLGISFDSRNYASDSTTGNIYRIDPNNFTDNGNTIPRQISTRHINFSGNEHGISELWMDMETGVGTNSGQGYDPVVTLEMSKDGGNTFGSPRPVNLGKIGKYSKKRVRWSRLGASRDFVFRFSVTDPVRFTIVSGSIEVRQGTQRQQGAEF